eukprot:TRINITY_DN105225_c3_g1_i1.p3 TRINITY_DN105225_c3_g1~~TRINITY_DN105225_c3_g1_i1.p3  ORF type:complete len:318 (+),score=39.61 TRINITY_DN105225_c3_g1_i1:309-1262(+)
MIQEAHMRAMLEEKEMKRKKKKEREKEKKKKKKEKKEDYEKTMEKTGALDHLDFHKKPLDNLLADLDTNKTQGLAEEKARERLQKYGPNTLKEKTAWPWYIKLLSEMFGLLQNIMWVAAILAFLGYGLSPANPVNVTLKIVTRLQLYLGVTIIIVILITSSFSFYQTRKSEAIMASFKDFIPPKASVLRGGKSYKADARNLVPGDIITVANGEKIPADIRIISANSMKVDNSSLTVSAKENRMNRENQSHFRKVLIILRKTYWKLRMQHSLGLNVWREGAQEWWFRPEKIRLWEESHCQLKLLDTVKQLLQEIYIAS